MSHAKMVAFNSSSGIAPKNELYYHFLQLFLIHQLAFLFHQLKQHNHHLITLMHLLNELNPCMEHDVQIK